MKKSSFKIYNTLFFRIYIYYAIMLALFAILIGFIFIRLYSQSSVDTVRQRLENQASNISVRMSEFVMNEDYQEGLSYLQVLQEVEKNKNILLTNDIWAVSNPSAKEPMSDRLENISLEGDKLNEEMEVVLNNAFNGKADYAASYSNLHGVEILTVGVPIYGTGGNVVGAILINSPVKQQQDAINSGRTLIVLSAILALFISFIIAILFARNLSNPISKMRITALELATGKYNVKTEIALRDELGDLAKAIDILSDKLLINEQERLNMEKMRQDFFANVSHELRTPITVVRAYAETLIDDVVTDEDKKKQYYKRMLSECKSMERLVGDLLVLSKMQNPEFAMEMEPVNIVQVFDDITRSVNAIGKKKNITLDMKKDKDVYIIHGDYDRLRQMFMIILDNAVKFSKEDSIVYIHIWEDCGLKISIKDDGVGISKEELPNIFDKFYKSKLRQNAKGSGLGLTIAKEIAIRHGGNIEVFSELNHGTEFVFQFNLTKEDYEEMSV